MTLVKEIKKEYMDLLRRSIMDADEVTNDINEGIKLLLRYDNGRRDKIIRELKRKNARLSGELTYLYKQKALDDLWRERHAISTPNPPGLWETIKNKFGFV